jgi:MFS family permease
LAFISVIFLPDIKSKYKISGRYEKAFIDFFKRIFEGYKFIKNNRLVIAPLLLLMILNISLVVIVVNIPVIAKEILRINLELAGALLVIPSAIGAGIAAISIPKKLIKGVRKITVIESSLFLLTISLGIFSIIVPLLTFSLKLLFSFIVLIMTGYSFVGIFIPTQTLLQEITPQELRGRVFGNLWFLLTLATIFPVIFSGAISELFGVRTLVFIFTIGFFGIVIFVKDKGKEFIQNGFKVKI